MPGAERKPNGRAKSTKYWSRYFIPRRHLSSGCIYLRGALGRSGKRLILMSIFSMSAGECRRMASSTVLYDNGNSPFRIPSLTLCSNGKDKSKIRRQAFGLFFFGITPKRLVCIDKGKMVSERVQLGFRWRGICRLRPDGQFTDADLSSDLSLWNSTFGLHAW